VTSSVDLDRLADYAAGVLEGADEAEVSHLVRTDPAWRSAYTALVAADDLVRTELRAEAHRRLEPMPADVVVRIDAALAELRPSGLRAEPPRLVDGPDHAVPARHRVAEVVPLASRTRRRRLALGFASAAAAVVLVLAGITVFGDMIVSKNENTSAAPAAGARGPEAADQAAPPPSALFDSGHAASTGTNYDAVGLAGLAATAARTSSLLLPSPIPAPFGNGASPTKAMAPQAPADKAAVPAPLYALAHQPQLATCLTAIRRAYPGTVVLLDYARYLGQPALIAVVAAEGHTTAVAVGPQCGVTGLDLLAVARG
jgi:hypothetical protein